MTRSTFDPDYAQVTSALRRIREAAGVSQRELADRLDREKSFISRLETGERRIDLLEFFWLCRACGTDASEEYASVTKKFAEASL